MATTLEEKRNMLVALEWYFFQNVKNKGGRADCQDNPETFYIMRKSQFDAWSENMINSYLLDLQTAKKTDRNPIVEKYAWMMRETSPEQFEKLSPLLPVLSEDILSLIQAIVKVQLSWMEDYVHTYPYIAARNRSVRAENNSVSFTSFETYLRGELCTYSLPTLTHYWEHIRYCRENSINLVCLTMNFTVQKYGYSTLDEANTQLQHTHISDA